MVTWNPRSASSWAVDSPPIPPPKIATRRPAAALPRRGARRADGVAADAVPGPSAPAAATAPAAASAPVTNWRRPTRFAPGCSVPEFCSVCDGVLSSMAHSLGEGANRH